LHFLLKDAVGSSAAQSLRRYMQARTQEEVLEHSISQLENVVAFEQIVSNVVLDEARIEVEEQQAKDSI
jgi:hypothetical protein